MQSSLRFRLVTATVMMGVTIVMLGVVAVITANQYADAVAKSQENEKILYDHALADLMHDALRSDVYAALYAASHAPDRKADILEETRDHAKTFKEVIARNGQRPLAPDVAAMLVQADHAISGYIAQAEKLVIQAFDEPENAHLSLVELEKHFAALEVTMRQIAERMQAAAATRASEENADAEATTIVSEAALAIGLLIGFVTLGIVLKDILAPLDTLTRGLGALATGDHTVKLPTLRKDEIGTMARTIEMFREESTARSRLTREARVFSQLNEWLQSAESEPELYQMIADVLGRLVPDCTGSIYIYANSRDVLDCVKVWNGSQSTLTMQPSDCWGLRRGRTYTFGESDIEFRCTHVGAEVANNYCCIPILAHGETVGLLHLDYAKGDGTSVEEARIAFAEQRRLGLAAAEHISLAIANVKLRDQLRDQSIRDVLTGLYNRRYMLETTRREFQRASRNGQPVSILSIDVDHFKRFNDNHGHDAGDTVLRAVGETLRATFRDDDVACRFGGEEFVVVLPGASLSDAANRAETLRARVEALTIRYAERNLPKITISVGIAAYPQSGTAPMEVLKVADDALYAAKHEGRNRVKTSASAMPTDSTAVSDDCCGSSSHGQSACCNPSIMPAAAE